MCGEQLVEDDAALGVVKDALGRRPREEEHGRVQHALVPRGVVVRCVVAHRLRRVEGALRLQVREAAQQLRPALEPVEAAHLRDDGARVEGHAAAAPAAAAATPAAALLARAAVPRRRRRRRRRAEHCAVRKGLVDGRGARGRGALHEPRAQQDLRVLVRPQLAVLRGQGREARRDDVGAGRQRGGHVRDGRKDSRVVEGGREVRGQERPSRRGRRVAHVAADVGAPQRQQPRARALEHARASRGLRVVHDKDVARRVGVRAQARNVRAALLGDARVQLALHLERRGSVGQRLVGAPAALRAGAPERPLLQRHALAVEVVVQLLRERKEALQVLHDGRHHQPVALDAELAEH